MVTSYKIRLIRLTLCFSALSFCLTAGRANGEENTPRSQAQVSIRLDKHEVTVGDEVQMREVISLPKGFGITSISYQGQLLAFYHRKQKRTIYLDDAWGRHLMAGFVTKFPSALGAPHGVPLDERRDGRLGLTTRISPNVPGIYLLSTRYTFQNGDGESFEVDSTNSTVLIVAPGDVAISELVDKRWTEMEKSMEHASGDSRDGLP